MQLTFTIQNPETHSPDSHLVNKVLSENVMGIYAFMGITADFAFWVDNVCVLKELYWNIGELAMQLNDWLKSGLSTSFQYNCMEAEEENLFSFMKTEDDFIFFSECADKNSTLPIEKTVLINFIKKYSNCVEIIISQQLGLDVSSFLNKVG